MENVHAKLTKTLIDSTRPGKKPRMLYDTEVTGLRLQISPRDKRSWYLQYRTHQRRQRNFKLGEYPATTPDAARKAATLALAAVHRGEDPADTKRKRCDRVTVAQLADRFLVEHVDVKLRSTTAVDYRRIIETKVKPFFREHSVDDVSFTDVERFHSSMRAAPGQANYAVRVISKLFNLAINWGIRTDRHNPAKGIVLFRENKRERYLTDAEIGRLWAILDENERAGMNFEVTLAFRLLLLTGRRLSEILGLRWEYLDLQEGIMRLPDSKVGAKSYHLAPSALALLRAAEARQKAAVSKGAGTENGRVRDNSSPFVLPGRIPGKPLANLQKAWQRIRRAANLTDVRIHDLRHTYASLAAAEGHDLLRIGAMLGHSSTQTTRRYTHLERSAVRRSVASVDEAFVKILGKPERDRKE